MSVSAQCLRGADVAARLDQLWAETLGLSTKPNDDFFADGGHSLLATRLLARVEKEFSVRIPLRDFVREPTRTAVARAIVSGAPDQIFRFQRLVRLGSGAAKPVFAVVHSNGAFFPLGQELGADHPFVALQAADRRHAEDLPATIEAMAASYVKQLRLAEPSGPYVLMGWCLAGTIAYEAAQQLLAEGEEVAAVMMVDTWCPSYATGMSALHRRLSEWSYSTQVILMDFSKVLRGRHSFSAFLERRNAIRRLQKGRSRSKTPSSEVHANYQADRDFDTRILGQVRDACRSYNPQPIGARVLLVRSSEEPRGFGLSRRLGWDRLRDRQWLMTTIRGDHCEVFMEPQIGILARAIREAVGLSRPVAAPVAVAAPGATPAIFAVSNAAS